MEDDLYKREREAETVSKDPVFTIRVPGGAMKDFEDEGVTTAWAVRDGEKFCVQLVRDE